MHRTMAVSTIFWMSLAVAASAAKAPPPPLLVKARQAFAAAVAAKDESRAAALTQFPFKNVVYKEPATLGRAAFHRRFDEYREMAACITKNPMELEGAGWVIDCDGSILHFELRGDRWLHTAYENVNE